MKALSCHFFRNYLISIILLFFFKKFFLLPLQEGKKKKKKRTPQTERKFNCYIEFSLRRWSCCAVSLGMKPRFIFRDNRILWVCKFLNAWHTRKSVLPVRHTCCQQYWKLVMTSMLLFQTFYVFSPFNFFLCHSSSTTSYLIDR